MEKPGLINLLKDLKSRGLLNIKAEYEAEGMSERKANRKARRDSRRAKRAMREGQHAQRKEAWSTFKGDQDIAAGEDAAAYENYYEQQ